jgi:magnesium chelatase family protein
LKDRIDLYIRIEPVDYKNILKDKIEPTSTSELKYGVINALKAQKERYKGMSFKYNSQIPDNKLSQSCNINQDGNELLNTICMNKDLSARSIGRIKRVARTIADIDGSIEVTDIHIAEALGYRPPQSGDLMN